MADDNLELVKSLQPAGVDLAEMFAPGAPAGYAPDLSRFAEDFLVEFVSSVPGAARPSYRGLAGFAEGWRDWLEPYASYRIDTEEFIAAGDDVVVLIRVVARTARDGVALDHEPAVVWSIAGGRVIGVRMYLDREDALREAGSAAPAPPAEEPRR